MENKSDSVTQESTLQVMLLQRTLASWRFLLLFVLPPMSWIIVTAQSGVLSALIALLCGAVCFGCWRLWLDAHYFALISEENNNDAGNALFFIWRKERLQTLTLVARQQGALKQLRYTMCFTALLWVLWLMILLYR